MRNLKKSHVFIIENELKTYFFVKMSSIRINKASKLIEKVSVKTKMTNKPSGISMHSLWSYMKILFHFLISTYLKTKNYKIWTIWSSHEDGPTNSKLFNQLILIG